MPDVSISNTPVQEELAQSESVTVPSGESWDVTIHLRGLDSGAVIDINGETKILATADIRPLETVLHSGDTVNTNNEAEATILGWVVRQ